MSRRSNFRTSSNEHSSKAVFLPFQSSRALITYDACFDDLVSKNKLLHSSHKEPYDGKHREILHPRKLEKLREGRVIENSLVRGDLQTHAKMEVPWPTARVAFRRRPVAHIRRISPDIGGISETRSGITVSRSFQQSRGQQVLHRKHRAGRFKGTFVQRDAKVRVTCCSMEGVSLKILSVKRGYRERKKNKNEV